MSAGTRVRTCACVNECVQWTPVVLSLLLTLCVATCLMCASDADAAAMVEAVEKRQKKHKEELKKHKEDLEKRLKKHKEELKKHKEDLEKRLKKDKEELKEELKDCKKHGVELATRLRRVERKVDALTTTMVGCTWQSSSQVILHDVMFAAQVGLQAVFAAKFQTDTSRDLPPSELIRATPVRQRAAALTFAGTLGLTINERGVIFAPFLELPGVSRHRVASAHPVTFPATVTNMIDVASMVTEALSARASPSIDAGAAASFNVTGPASTAAKRSSRP
jgi:hypothetical protein